MFKGFSPGCRIRTHAEYQRVFAKRQRLYSCFFLLYYCASIQNRPRLGIVVSKRNARLAVARNRIKRKAREAFRERQNRLPPIDIVIIAKRGAGEASKEELQSCLEQLFNRLMI